MKLILYRGIDTVAPFHRFWFCQIKIYLIVCLMISSKLNNTFAKLMHFVNEMSEKLKYWGSFMVKKEFSINIAYRMLRIYTAF